MKTSFAACSVAAVVMAMATTSTTCDGALLRGQPQKDRSLLLLLAKRTLPDFPTSRYRDWSTLEDKVQTQANDILDYDKKSWNTPQKADIELLSFFTINATSLGIDIDDVDGPAGPAGTGTGTSGSTSVSRSDDPANPTTPIGVIMYTLEIMDEDVWDCHINHYRDYFWEELVELEIVANYETLGWTQEEWEAEEGFAETEDMDWYELSNPQKMAAENVCYFPELWASDVPIVEWTFEPPPPPPATAPTTPGTTETGNEGIFVPPTIPPTDPNSTATMTPVVERPVLSPWDIPVTRLTLWEDLSAVQHGHAVTLGFNETTWNSPGTALIEKTAFLYDDLSPPQIQAATALDIDEFFWNCLIQHYYGTGWNALQALGVQTHWETLGWTRESWHGIASPPPAEAKFYIDLTQNQQAAALQLCYLPGTYHRESHLANVTLASLTAPPSTAGSSGGGDDAGGAGGAAAANDASGPAPDATNP